MGNNGWIMTHEKMETNFLIIQNDDGWPRSDFAYSGISITQNVGLKLALEDGFTRKWMTTMTADWRSWPVCWVLQGGQKQIAIPYDWQTTMNVDVRKLLKGPVKSSLLSR